MKSVARGPLALFVLSETEQACPTPLGDINSLAVLKPTPTGSKKKLTAFVAGTTCTDVSVMGGMSDLLALSTCRSNRVTCDTGHATSGCTVVASAPVLLPEASKRSWQELPRDIWQFG